MRRWIVQDGDGHDLAAILPRAAPGDPSALADGRVFVGRRRALAATDTVRPGDEVTIAPPAAAHAAIEILARGRGWVAVDKPSGLPTIPDQGGSAHSLLALAARALSLSPSQLHATSRLDREVSGVVLFALDRRAAERLHAAREEHRYVRRYVAIAARSPAIAGDPASPEGGTWDAPIGRGKDARHRAVNGRDAAPSRTHFAVVCRSPGDAVVLAVAPITGRTHQIRVHAANAGAPLLGDRAYGGPSRAALPSGRVLAYDRIALHAARVTVEGVQIVSPVPAPLRATWLALGGDDAAWEKAVSWPLADR